jgi:ADP-ribose pyrophosphatase YjhB (NUDIX family)
MIPTYCPYCGAKTIKKHDDSKYECTTCHKLVWNNPMTAVGVVFLQGDQILAAKRGGEPSKGKYDLPGGFLDYGEDPFEAAVRELQEEAGVHISGLELIGAYTHQFRTELTTCDVIVWCKQWQGTFTANDDVADLVWKPIDFIDSGEFAWPYPGLAAKLKTLAAQNSQSTVQ